MNGRASVDERSGGQTGAIVRVIAPRAREIGGITVRRLLPAAEQRMVGPFVFFDQFGPLTLAPGQGLDVRPHPHIGLATLTWLFAGELLHRDSIGSVQRITPGAVNWMTAGSGIVHSERTPDDVRAGGSALFGLQTWLALPQADEETAPAFQHAAAAALPVIATDGCRVVLIAGTGWQRRSPVRVFSPTLYAEATLAAGAALTVPADHAERAIYVLSGAVEIAGAEVTPGPLVVLGAGAREVRARKAARLVVIGGAPLDGDRLLWWNFVSSRPERIAQAKADWNNGRFARVAGDDEFIPLPGD